MSWADIPGWYDWQWFYDEAVASAPTGATLVEVGVAFGRSIAYLARRAIDAGRADLRIIAVDPWADDWTTPEGWEEHERPTWGGEHAEWARSVGGPFSAFVESMRKHAPEELERIQVWRMTSECAYRCLSHDETVYMVFLDGDHRYEAVSQEIWQWSVWYPVKMLGGHDYSPDFPGVMRAVDELVGEKYVAATTWIKIHEQKGR